MEGFPKSGRFSKKWKVFQKVEGFPKSGRFSKKWKVFQKVEGFPKSGRFSKTWKVNNDCGPRYQVSDQIKVIVNRTEKPVEMTSSHKCIPFNISAFRRKEKKRLVPTTKNIAMNQ